MAIDQYFQLASKDLYSSHTCPWNNSRRIATFDSCRTVHCSADDIEGSCVVRMYTQILPDIDQRLQAIFLLPFVVSVFVRKRSDIG